MCEMNYTMYMTRFVIGLVCVKQYDILMSINIIAKPLIFVLVACD
jgi:hypothetical protein